MRTSRILPASVGAMALLGLVTLPVLAQDTESTPATSGETLAGSAWNVISVGPAPPARDQSIRFEAEGGLAVSTGCATYTGSYRVDGEQLEVDGLSRDFGSLEECSFGESGSANVFLDTLEKAQTWRTDADGQLVIDASGGWSLALEPAADDGSGADGSGADGTEDAEPADTAADRVQTALEDLDLGAGTAVVTIGDERYEFTLEGTSTVGSTTYVGICREIFGLIQAHGYATDGRDVTVDMEIPPTDWETFTDGRYGPPRVEVEDNEANASWVADPGSAFAADSGVDDYQQADGSATGTARFANQWAPDSEPVTGSFEVSCETD